MAGRRPFEGLRSRMAPNAQAEAEAEARRLDEEVNLAELRRALKLSQDEIGETLRIPQGSVAEMEESADLYVSTVRRFIEAMGGELEIVARFADHSVTIETFAGLHAKE